MKFVFISFILLFISLSSFAQMTGSEVNSKSNSDNTIMAFTPRGCAEALAKAQKEGAEAGCYAENAMNFVSKIPDENATVSNGRLTVIGGEKVFLYKQKKVNGLKIYYFEGAFNAKAMKGFMLMK